ncbi:hypothetical protein [Parasphingorhabdus sp.]|uniref:hypothetical protein n=1 Tax=Parasphingorhabdus sp. TaxID=2709688 RepID=UPI003BAE2D3D
MFRKLSGAAAIIALINSTSIQAAETGQCISAEAAESLITYVIPGALGAVRSSCADSLPATAALLQSNSDQMQRYEEASRNAWPQASLAMRSMFGEDLPEDIGIDVVRPFVDAMIPALIAQEVKPADCPNINKVYTLLEPMPTANLASLTVMLAQLGKDSDVEGESRRKDPFNICKDAAE